MNLLFWNLDCKDLLVQSKCLTYYFLANYFWHLLPFLSWCTHQIDKSHPLLPGFSCNIFILTGNWNGHSKSQICWDSKPHFSEFKGSSTVYTWTFLSMIFGCSCSQGTNTILFTLWHRDPRWSVQRLGLGEGMFTKYPLFGREG